MRAGGKIEQVRTVTTQELRRVIETRRSFINWLSLLEEIALQRFGRGSDVLRFRTRTGLVVECPNRPGARVPVYEVFAEDWYRLPWFLAGLIDKPITVLDVGGHIGTFALHMASVNPEARIHCFEPSPTTARFLRRNVEQNGLDGRITVVESALAAERGQAQLADNRSGSGLNRLVSLQTGVLAGLSTMVRTVAFDEVVRETGPVDVVKIDCEGGEYDFVLGSSPSSWSSVERVVLEYHRVEGRSWDELRSWFADRGLHLVEHDSAVAGYGAAWLSRHPLPT